MSRKYLGTTVATRCTVVRASIGAFLENFTRGIKYKKMCLALAVRRNGGEQHPSGESSVIFRVRIRSPRPRYCERVTRPIPEMHRQYDRYVSKLAGENASGWKSSIRDSGFPLVRWWEKSKRFVDVFHVKRSREVKIRNSGKSANFDLYTYIGMIWIRNPFVSYLSCINSKKNYFQS